VGGGGGLGGDRHRRLVPDLEVPEQMALAERGDEELLGVPALRVAAEVGVRGSRERRLARRRDLVVARVRA